MYQSGLKPKEQTPYIAHLVYKQPPLEVATSSHYILGSCTPDVITMHGHVYTDQTYIGCNWQTRIKEACYDGEIAEVSKSVCALSNDGYKFPIFS